MGTLWKDGTKLDLTVCMMCIYTYIYIYRSTHAGAPVCALPPAGGGSVAGKNPMGLDAFQPSSQDGQYMPWNDAGTQTLKLGEHNQTPPKIQNEAQRSSNPNLVQSPLIPRNLEKSMEAHGQGPVTLEDARGKKRPLNPESPAGSVPR